MVPTSTDGADVPLRLAVVAERAPRRHDSAAQRGIPDEAPTPDGIEQFVPADEAVMMSDQFRDHGEYLRLDADTFVSAPQFGTTGVEDEVVEAPRPAGWG